MIFTAALVTLRTFRNLLAPPFIVFIDTPERVFQFPTRYNVVSIELELQTRTIDIRYLIDI